MSRRKTDPRAVVKALAQLAGTVVAPGVPVGAGFDLWFGLAGTDAESTFEERLVHAIEEWAARHRRLMDAIGGVPSGLPDRLVAAQALLQRELRTPSSGNQRDVAVDAVASTVFTPLSSGLRGASLEAAEQFLDDLPELVIACAEPGFAALRYLLDSSVSQLAGVVDEMLERVSADPASDELIGLYLLELIRDLDHDPWTRHAGGHETSIGSIALRLNVRTRSDDGYGSAPRNVKIFGDMELDGFERVVVVGEAGSGKTWLAKRAGIRAAIAAIDALPNDVARLPLYVTWPDLAARAVAGEHNAWASCVEVAVRRLGHRFTSSAAQDALVRRFVDGDDLLLLIVDGLDEAPGPGSDELLDRVVGAAGRDLRLVVTTRPEAWIRQVPLEAPDRHVIAEVLPMRYPQDVDPAVRRWLADAPSIADELLARMASDDALAQTARSPLLCAMYCLLAKSSDSLPVDRWELYSRVLTRLTEGAWTGQPDPNVRDLARRELRKLAWDDDRRDPRTEIAEWRERLPAGESSDRVLRAMDHVAPRDFYDPDRPSSRRFIHRSLREHLIVEYLADLPATEVGPVMERHLWYDVTWASMLVQVVAHHPERETLLRRIIVGEFGTLEATPQRLNERDGLGELRRLLADLATTTAYSSWPSDLAALIDASTKGSIGFGEARLRLGWPNAVDAALRDIRAGRSPRGSGHPSAWIAALDLDDGERAGLATVLAQQPHDGATTAETLLALGASDSVLKQAAEGLRLRLSRVALPDDVVALHTLGAAVGDDFARSLLSQLPPVSSHTRLSEAGELWPDEDVDAICRVAECVVLLDGPADVREAVADEVLRSLGERTHAAADLRKLCVALDRLRPDPDRSASGLDTVLQGLHDADWSRRQLIVDSARQLTKNRSVGDVLVALCRRTDGWEVTDELISWFDTVEAELPDADREPVCQVLVERLADIRAPATPALARLVVRLAQHDDSRHAASATIIGRLPDRLIDPFLLEALRELRPRRDQCAMIVSRLTELLDVWPESTLDLIYFAGWFGPDDDANDVLVERLLARVSASDKAPPYLAGAVSAVDPQDRRNVLGDTLNSLLARCPSHDVSSIAQLVRSVDPDSLGATHDVVYARIEEAGDQDFWNLVDAIVFDGVDQRRAGKILDRYCEHASGPAAHIAVPKEELRILLDAAGNRDEGVAKAIVQLVKGPFPMRAAETLTNLGLAPYVHSELCNRLVKVLEAWGHDGPDAAELLARIVSDPDQRTGIATDLLRHEEDLSGYQLHRWLTLIADLSPDGETRLAARQSALAHLADRDVRHDEVAKALVDLEADHSDRQQAIEILAGCGALRWDSGHAAARILCPAPDSVHRVALALSDTEPGRTATLRMLAADIRHRSVLEDWVAIVKTWVDMSAALQTATG